MGEDEADGCRCRWAKALLFMPAEGWLVGGAGGCGGGCLVRRLDLVACLEVEESFMLKWH